MPLRTSTRLGRGGRVFAATALCAIAGLAAVSLTHSLAATTTKAIPGFEIFCFYSHTAQDDPIVAPGRPGDAMHLHDFAGNTTTNANSTAASLRAGATNCQLKGDTAAYWTPVLYSQGTVVHPDRLHSYYRWGTIADVATIKPIPAGLKMVAGSAMSSVAQPTSVVGWNCGVQGQKQYDHPISCRSGQKIVEHFFFPNCWDGANLDSADHASHMAYSHNGSCPASHPVAIPRLTEDYGYPITDATDLTLSSGSYKTAHADFWNTWDQDVMIRLTHDCINAGKQCGPQRSTGTSSGAPAPAAAVPAAAVPAAATLTPGGRPAVSGASTTTRAGLADLISNVPGNAVYGLHDSVGHTMDTAKIVADPTTAGRYLAVYHWLNGSTMNVGVSTSTDLTHWTYRRTLDSNGSQPYLAFSPAPKNGPILALEGTPSSHLRFRYWTTVAGMLGTTAAYKTFDAPRTLSSCAEGTPSITSVSYASSSSTITSGSTIKVAHHYFAGCTTDRQAAGTLTNFGSWTTGALPATDDALTSAGAVGKHGDRDTFTYLGASWQLFEGQDSSAQTMGDWRPYLYDGSTATQLVVHTAGGSTALANPSVTTLTIGGAPCLLVTLFIPQEGAASGESGELLYWRSLGTSPTPSPTVTASSSPTPTVTPTATISPTPTVTSSPPSGHVTKILTFIEENHSLTQMKAGMPYLFSLAQRFSYADHYTAITHPSEPNYVAIAFGSTMGDTADHGSGQDYAGPTVFDQAIESGKTARVYQESMPSNCYNANSGAYYTKHNPWLQVGGTEHAQCQAGDVPSGTSTSGALLSDITANNLPNAGFVTPNINDDAHDGTLGTADNWLKGWMPRILASSDFTSGRLAVVVTADEDDRNSGNTVLTTVLHASLDGQHLVVSTPLTHYSLTRLYGQIDGTPPLRNASTAPDMRAAFNLP